MSRPVNSELDAIVEPRPIEVAWAAGIYEGEGYTCICKSKKDGYVGQTAQVVVAQKGPEILHRLKRYFGGSVNAIQGKHPHYRWVICGARARNFLISVYPHLSERRRDQASPVIRPSRS